MSQNRIFTDKALAEERARAQAQDMLHFVQSNIAKKFAQNNYCVMNKARTTIVKDPGLDRPFHTPYKNRAESVAKQVDGVVETLHDALQHILNHLGKGIKNRS